MLVSDALNLLRLDMGDMAGELLGDEYLCRCIARSLPMVNVDLGLSFILAAGEIMPDPEPGPLELIILRARIGACALMRSITARNFKFSSADKSVDKTMQPGFWADLQKDLESQYKAALKQLKPESALNGDDILTTPSTRPAIYEQGSDPSVVEWIGSDLGPDGRGGNYPVF